MRKLSVVLMAVLAIAFMGCNKEKLITLQETSATLHHGETYELNAKCENPITYSSADEYHAQVSADGLVTANYIGNTTITLQSEEDTKTFSVTVDPVSNLYTEPNITFGESKASVIAKLGDPDLEEEGIIGYTYYAAHAPLLAVLFDEYGNVEYYGVYVDAAYGDELNNIFLEERYKYFTYDEGTYVYINSLNINTATMIVGSDQDDDGSWITIYMAYESKSSRQSAIDTLKAFVK